MVKIIIGDNDGNQRLDRFLRKYLSDKVPLSFIYKFIRKGVKVNGAHFPEDGIIMPGDELWFNVTEEELSEIRRHDEKYVLTMRNAALAGESLPYLNVVFEDANVLVVNKPKGILTHGDQNEKKNHLTNQVIDYLIKKGEYNPRTEKTFSPAPVNRLDRNTSGLVAFGKNAPALQELNEMIRDTDAISKIYLTLVAGKMEVPLTLKSRMVKDENENLVSVIDKELPDGKYMETHVIPIHHGQFKDKWYTLVQVEIVTGRTHQIRAHLASAGFPVIGDPKYGDPKVNAIFAKDFQVSSQLLHAYKLAFNKIKEEGKLHYLEGTSIQCDIPKEFKKVNEAVLGHDYMKQNVGIPTKVAPDLRK